MIMTENATDGKLGEILDAATGLFNYVRQAAEDGTPIHEVEKGVWQRMLQMGREALDHFLERQKDGDFGETLTMPDGHEMKRLERPHARCYQSIFGEFQLKREMWVAVLATMHFFCDPLLCRMLPLGKSADRHYCEIITLA